MKVKGRKRKLQVNDIVNDVCYQSPIITVIESLVIPSKHTNLKLRIRTNVDCQDTSEILKEKPKSCSVKKGNCIYVCKKNGKTTSTKAKGKGKGRGKANRQKSKSKNKGRDNQANKDKPRRNSEKRKEKSRDAARCRRGKESEIFSELGLLLPLLPSVSANLDKASVIRVAIAYLRTRSLATWGLNVAASSEGVCLPDLPPSAVGEDGTMDMFLRALDGFLLVLTKEGDIVYASENITTFLGMTQVDVMGQSLLDYTHPCDHDEVRQLTSLSKGGSSNHTFLRFKCTITPKGRSVNLKSATYKVVQVTGQILRAQMDDKEDKSDSVNLKEETTVVNEESWVVALGVPVPHPSNIEVPLDKQTFVSKHSLDMKFTYVDENVYEFCGYCPSDLLGQSLYQMHHALDTHLVREAYKTLRSKGQVETERYRFLSHGGGYVWVVTQATLITGHRDSKPQYVVCLNYVISAIESPSIIFSDYQLKAATIKSHPTSVLSPQSIPRPVSLPSLIKPLGSPPSLIPEAVYNRPVVSTAPPTHTVSSKPAPVAATISLLTNRTEDMNEGYLTFTDNDPHAAVLKEEPEDLTHLAPSVGEDCGPLEVPIFIPGLEDFLTQTQNFDLVQSTNYGLPKASVFDLKENTKNKSIEDPIVNIINSSINSENSRRREHLSGYSLEVFQGQSWTPTQTSLSQSNNKITTTNKFQDRIQRDFADSKLLFATNPFNKVPNYSIRLSHKVPEGGVTSPSSSGGSPGTRFDTPEPPLSPTPLLSQAASPHTPEKKPNSVFSNSPKPTIATSRLFTELDETPPSSSMDLFTNLDLKLEDDLDLRAPYIPLIDEVLVFGHEELFLANSSDDMESIKEEDHYFMSGKNLDREEISSGINSFSCNYGPYSPPHSFHSKISADTGGRFVDPNQVLPGQFIVKGEDKEDSSQELRYLLEAPPPSPVKEPVDPPPPLRSYPHNPQNSPSKIGTKRAVSPQSSPPMAHKRIRPFTYVTNQPTNQRRVSRGVISQEINEKRDVNSLPPPPHAPIMQQLLVSKEPIMVRGRIISSGHSAPTSSEVGSSKRATHSSQSHAHSHSVLRNLLVSGRDDLAGYTVVVSSLSPEHSSSSSNSHPNSPHISDDVNEDKADDEDFPCLSPLQALHAIPVNKDGKVELTRQQLTALLGKAGVLQPTFRLVPAADTNSSSSKSSPFMAGSSQKSSFSNVKERPFLLVDSDLSIPSLFDLTSLDCEVNAPAPTPSLLQGADLLMALDQTQ